MNKERILHALINVAFAVVFVVAVGVGLWRLLVNA
jgi:hypothetical protein